MMWFVHSIPTLISDPSVALSSLIQLVPHEEQSALSGSTNPLFDEDPINEYVEEVILLQHVSNSLRDLLNTRQELSLDLLATEVADIDLSREEEGTGRDGDKEVISPGVCGWGNQGRFRYFLRGVLKGRCFGDTSTAQGVDERDKIILKHPMFS